MSFVWAFLIVFVVYTFGRYIGESDASKYFLNIKTRNNKYLDIKLFYYPSGDWFIVYVNDTKFSLGHYAAAWAILEAYKGYIIGSVKSFYIKKDVCWDWPDTLSEEVEWRTWVDEDE